MTSPRGLIVEKQANFKRFLQQGIGRCLLCVQVESQL